VKHLWTLTFRLPQTFPAAQPSLERSRDAARRLFLVDELTGMRHLIESDFHLQVTMGYADVQKLHHIRLLQDQTSVAGREEVLRLVLAIVLDVETAAWCLGCPGDAPIARWPSTLYRLLARAALESPAIWRRCAVLVDRTLHDAVLPYTERSAAELTEAFLEGRETLQGDELAGLLWCLVRSRCRSHDLVAERLSLELEVVAARRLRGHPAS
jgi:hypothetical protein